jgi:branched-chain amino acid transport system substrate-binding protein
VIAVPRTCHIASAAIAYKLGLRSRGVYDVDDKTNTWVADYWLFEAWSPSSGFSPDTELINEVERQDQPAQSDTIEKRHGQCVRWRHLRSRFFTAYDFRRFPFDTQRLELAIADGEYNADELTYESSPARSTVDEVVSRQLPGWKPTGTLEYHRAQRAFDSGDEARTKYDCATFSVPVRRRPLYHIAKFFLPLFLIVAVAFSCFWIGADDLQSRIGIGVTCLLAVIAFQLTQTGSLPQVDYLTLADRVYVSCYVATAAAVVESVYVNALARHERTAFARHIDRSARWVFALSLVAAVAVSAVSSI